MFLLFLLINFSVYAQVVPSFFFNRYILSVFSAATIVPVPYQPMQVISMSSYHFLVLGTLCILQTSVQVLEPVGWWEYVKPNIIYLTEINEMDKLVISRSSIQDRAQGHLNAFLKFLLQRPLVSLEGSMLPNSYLDLVSKRSWRGQWEFTSVFLAFAFCFFFL